MEIGNQKRTEEERGSVAVTYLAIGLFGLMYLLVKADALNAFWYWFHRAVAG